MLVNPGTQARHGTAKQLSNQEPAPLISPPLPSPSCRPTPATPAAVMHGHDPPPTPLAPSGRQPLLGRRTQPTPRARVYSGLPPSLLLETASLAAYVAPVQPRLCCPLREGLLASTVATGCYILSRVVLFGVANMSLPLPLSTTIAKNPRLPLSPPPHA